MEKYAILAYLRKIIPDIDIFTDRIQNIIESDLDYETKVVKILSKHFKTKREKHLLLTVNEILVNEANDLHKLFPSKSFQYLYDQLEIFKDMPNRKEIVLRLLVNSKNSVIVTNGTILTTAVSKAPVKRVMAATEVSQNNIKIRKVSDVPESDSANGKMKPKTKIIQAAKLDVGNFGLPTSTVTSSQTLNSVIRPTKFKNVNNNYSKVPMTTIIFKNDFGYECSKPATVSTAPSSNTLDSVIQTSPLDYRDPSKIRDLEDDLLFSNLEIPETVRISSTSSSADGLEMTELSKATADPRNCAEYPKKNQQKVSFDNPSEQNTKLEVVESDILVGRNCTVGFSDESVSSDLTLTHSNQLEKLPSLDISPVEESVNVDDQNNAKKGFSRSNSIRIRTPADINNGRELTDENSSSSQDTGTTTSSSSSTQEYYGTTSPEKEFLDAELIKGAELPVASNYVIKMNEPEDEVDQIESPLPVFTEHNDEQSNLLDSSNMSIEEQWDDIEGFIREDVSRYAPSLERNNPSVPAINKQEQLNPNINPGEANFNLVDYVFEITNVDKEAIKKCCTRLSLPVNVKPPGDVLNILLDNIFTGDDSGDDSDSAVVMEAINLTRDDDTINSKNKTEKPSSTEQKVVKSDETNKKYDVQLVNSLCSIFPDACPNYVKGLCKGKVMDNVVLDDLITVILNTNNTYPKRPKPEPEPETVPENQFEILQEFLPDADPDYLRMMCDKFEGKPDLVKSFLNEAMEKRNYPTMKEYQRRQQLSAQQKQYTTEFTVENFMKIIPDPHTFFSDPSRNIKLDPSSAHYALIFLRNIFNRLPVRVIQAAFTKNGTKLSRTIKELRSACTQSNLVMKSVRKATDLPKNIENIPLLQEIAYYTHEYEINEYLKQMKEKEETERLDAKNKGLLKTCNCCFDEEVLPKDVCSCEKGCEFCKSCVVKSAEVRFGEQKLDFPCLMNCDSGFSLQTLQTVLSPKLFSKIAQKKTLEEVKSAGIQELEFCPFCDFATIPAEGYNIFTCMNPECMKESCRTCKEPSHIPLRCDEIEKDEDVRARTFVENKMTEALLRKCYKCGIKFFKEEGCNKMTCSCGAQMCYVCGKPVTSYKHFNGNGGDRFDLCPLYSDSNVLNKENVLKGAEQAKAELGNVNLKHDPTVDVAKHYKERSKRNPQAHLLAGQVPIFGPPVPVFGDHQHGGQVHRMMYFFQQLQQQQQRPHQRH